MMKNTIMTKWCIFSKQIPITHLCAAYRYTMIGRHINSSHCPSFYNSCTVSKVQSISSLHNCWVSTSVVGWLSILSLKDCQGKQRQKHSKLAKRTLQIKMRQRWTKSSNRATNQVPPSICQTNESWCVKLGERHRKAWNVTLRPNSRTL